MRLQLNKHLGLWDVKPRPPPLMPKAQMLSTEPHIDYSDSQVLPSDNVLCVDPEYAEILPSALIFRI